MTELDTHPLEQGIARRILTLGEHLATGPCASAEAFDDNVRRWFSTLAALINDAIVADDSDTLVTARDWLRALVDAAEHDTLRAMATGLLDVCRAGVAETHRDRAWQRTEAGSVRARVLAAIVATPGISNDTLATNLGTDKTVISRALRGLLQDRLVVAKRYGRRNSLKATSSGRTVLDRVFDETDNWNSIELGTAAQRQVDRLLSEAAKVVLDEIERQQRPTNSAVVVGKVGTVDPKLRLTTGPQSAHGPSPTQPVKVEVTAGAIP